MMLLLIAILLLGLFFMVFKRDIENLKDNDLEEYFIEEELLLEEEQEAQDIIDILYLNDEEKN